MQVNKIALLTSGDVFDQNTVNGSVYAGLCKLGKVEQSAPHLINTADFAGFDIIVSNGQRGRIKAVLDTYRDEIPCMVYDLGYINRDPYYQLSLGQLNNIPTEIKYPDRLYTHKNFTVWGQRPNHHSAVFHVFYTQKPFDAQHNMDIGQIQKMLDEWRSKLLQQGVASNHIFYRAHPKAQEIFYRGVDRLELDYEQTVALTKVGYTYNSTTCVDLISKCVPVEILDKSSIYQVFSGLEKVDVSYKRQFFNRLCNTQWNLEELSSGQPFTDLYDRWLAKDTVNIFYPPNVPGEQNMPVFDAAVISKMETIQAWVEYSKDMKFFQLKKAVKELTGTSPKNKADADALVASHFNKI